MGDWSRFQEMPHDQVNWAALAQQWMATRSYEEPQPPPPPSGYDDWHNFGQYDSRPAPYPNGPPPPRQDFRPPPPHDHGRPDYSYQNNQYNDFRPDFQPSPPARSERVSFFSHHQEQQRRPPHPPPQRDIYNADLRNGDTWRNRETPAPPPPPAKPMFPAALNTMEPSNNGTKKWDSHPYAGVPTFNNSTFPTRPPPPGSFNGPPLFPGAGVDGRPAPPTPKMPPPALFPSVARPPQDISLASSRPPSLLTLEMASSTSSEPKPVPPADWGFGWAPLNRGAAAAPNTGTWNPESTDQMIFSSQPPVLDAAARKKLPAWILEGLEKAEREKQKQLEKEERIRKAEEERAKRRALAGKGKFDSSSDEEEESDSKEQSSPTSRREWDNGGDPLFQKKQTDEPDIRISKEVLAKMKLDAVKLLMMELLSTSTITTMKTAFREVVTESKTSKTKRGAEPKLLAKSSALAALSSLGGDDESDSDSEDSKSPSDNSDAVFKAPIGFGIARNMSKTEKSSAEKSEPSPERGDVCGRPDHKEQHHEEGEVSSKKKYRDGDRDEDHSSRSRKRKSRSRSSSRERERRRSRSPKKSRKRSRSRERKKSRSPKRSRSRRSRSRSKERRRRSRSRERRHR